MIQQSPSAPACRIDATPEDLQRESDRSVLYVACLLMVRPDTRIKPHLQEAVNALLPSVRAYFAGDQNEYAAHAMAYADACGGRAFLDQKMAQYRARNVPGS